MESRSDEASLALRPAGGQPGEGAGALAAHSAGDGSSRDLDVARTDPRLLLYSIVISQGRRNDVARFLNAERLRDDWPQLGHLLSRRMRRACERRLGLPRH